MGQFLSFGYLQNKTLTTVELALKMNNQRQDTSKKKGYGTEIMV